MPCLLSRAGVLRPIRAALFYLESAFVSDHSTLFADTGLAAIVATQGDESLVRYVTTSGVEIACTAVVGQESLEDAADTGGRDQVRTRTVLIQATDVELPRLKATCWVGSVEYAVRDVQASGDGCARVLLIRTAPSELTRGNYRREQSRPQPIRR